MVRAAHPKRGNHRKRAAKRLKPRGGKRQIRQWLGRYTALAAYIRLHGRFPDRHRPESAAESSLAWWLKDQRRKMRIGDSATRKRGSLNGAQVKLLRGLHVEPDFHLGFPARHYQKLSAKLRRR